MPFTDYINTFINLAYPRICYSCDKEVGDTGNALICDECLGEIYNFGKERCFKCGLGLGPYTMLSKTGCVMCNDVKLWFDATYSVAGYKGPARKIIHRFKYGRILTLSSMLGEILANGTKNFPEANEADMIAPVPLYWKHRVKRGFNQSLVMANRLAKYLSLPVSNRNLRRVRNTVTQTNLTRAQRHDNVYDAFAVKNSVAIEGKKILLVDDVMTTGVTASECARALKEGGAEKVFVITIARAEMG